MGLSKQCMSEFISMDRSQNCQNSICVEADESDGGSWWTKSYAQFSSDGGRRWGDYSGLSIGAKKRDLGVVFTLVGGPRDKR